MDIYTDFNFNFFFYSLPVNPFQPGVAFLYPLKTSENV